MQKEALRIRVHCLLLWKRMWKTHKFFIFLCLTPLVVWLAGRFTEGKEAKIQIAVCMESLTGAQDTAGREFADEPEKELVCGFAHGLQEQLAKKEGMVTFVLYESEEEVKEAVASARAECGYVIPSDFLEKLAKKKYNRLIRAYESPQSSMQRLCEEVFFAELFAVYEEQTFGREAAGMLLAELEQRNSAAGMDLGSAADADFDNAAGTDMEKELTVRADELYETYLYNGSTFQFTYEKYEGDGGKVTEKDNTAAAGSKMLRGILALLMFVCGLCGTLDVLEDEKSKRTARLQGAFAFKVFTIYLPILFMSILLLLCLKTADTWKGVHIWQGTGTELLRLFVYQIILVGYCLLLKMICKTEERLAAVIPVLLLMTVVVCPVFVDTAQFVPAFRILEKVFPVTYYINM